MSETPKLAAILAADLVGFGWLAAAGEDRAWVWFRSLRSSSGRLLERAGAGCR